jgi:hypothetical protein
MLQKALEDVRSEIEEIGDIAETQASSFEEDDLEQDSNAEV